MNERQRDLFLWLWSRRRKPGLAAIGLRGAAIGAIGGLVFASILAPNIVSPDIHAYEIGAQFIANLPLFGMSIAAFAWLGWLGASRVYAQQEAMYQAMLASGARVPDEKPVMQMSDRGPALAVAIAVVLIAGFIGLLLLQYG
ncbi:MAG: hypothetical protein AB7O98_01350 [Hyphomonadaceae bacterium]